MVSTHRQLALHKRGLWKAFESWKLFGLGTLFGFSQTLGCAASSGCAASLGCERSLGCAAPLGCGNSLGCEHSLGSATSFLNKLQSLSVQTVGKEMKLLLEMDGPELLRKPFMDEMFCCLTFQPAMAFQAYYPLEN